MSLGKVFVPPEAQLSALDTGNNNVDVNDNDHYDDELLSSKLPTSNNDLYHDEEDLLGRTRENSSNLTRSLERQKNCPKRGVCLFYVLVWAAIAIGCGAGVTIVLGFTIQRNNANSNESSEEVARIITLSPTVSPSITVPTSASSPGTNFSTATVTPTTGKPTMSDPLPTRNSGSESNVIGRQTISPTATPSTSASPLVSMSQPSPPSSSSAITSLPSDVPLSLCQEPVLPVLIEPGNDEFAIQGATYGLWIQQEASTGCNILDDSTITTHLTCMDDGIISLEYISPATPTPLDCHYAEKNASYVTCTSTAVTASLSVGVACFGGTASARELYVTVDPLSVICQNVSQGSLLTEIGVRELSHRDFCDHVPNQQPPLCLLGSTLVVGNPFRCFSRYSVNCSLDDAFCEQSLETSATALLARPDGTTMATCQTTLGNRSIGRVCTRDVECASHVCLENTCQKAQPSSCPCESNRHCEQMGADCPNGACVAPVEEDASALGCC